jgi:hypothetical protein
MKLSVSFWFLDLGQSAVLLGRVISSSQGLCELPRVIVMMMMMEKLVECMVLAGETEALGEKLPRRHFVHHKSYLPDPSYVSPVHRLETKGIAHEQHSLTSSSRLAASKSS